MMKGGWFKVYTLVYLLFLYAPIVLLPIFAFNDATVIAFPLQGFTTEMVRRAVGRARTCARRLKNSLIIAVSVVDRCRPTLGIFAARASTRYSFPGQGRRSWG